MAPISVQGSLGSYARWSAVYLHVSMHRFKGTSVYQISVYRKVILNFHLEICLIKEIISLVRSCIVRFPLISRKRKVLDFQE